MPARLNRRRYREAVALLKEVIADKRAPQQRRLEAVRVLLTIFDRHDASEARRERRAQAAAQTVPDTPETSESITEPDEPQDPEYSAKVFLESLKYGGNGE